jgi:hypothetical protein
MNHPVANKITKCTILSLSKLQLVASRNLGLINGVWKVDDTYAVELKPFSTVDGWEGKGEPTHWWKNEKWEPVTFLSLTETKEAPVVVTDMLYRIPLSMLTPGQRAIAEAIGEVKQYWLSSKGTFFASIDSVNANYFWSAQRIEWLSVQSKELPDGHKFVSEQDMLIPLDEIDFDNEEQVEKLKRQKVEVEVGLLAYLLGYYYTGGGEPDSLNARLDDSMQAVKD